MDSSYYQNHLAYLFKSSDSKDPAIYNVDQLLFNYTTADTVNNNLDLSKCFNVISGLSYKRETVEDVMERMNAPDTLQPKLLPGTTAFTEDSTQNEVRIELTYNATELPVSIVQTISDEVNAVSGREMKTNDLIVNAKGDITKSHRAMDNYMRGVISSICSLQMREALRRAHPITGIKDLPNNLDDAAEVITTGISSKRKDLLFSVVSDACKKVFHNILNELPTIRNDVMKNFNNTSSSFTRPLYYQLRSELISSMYLPTNIVPDQDDHVLLFIKRILADIYIKTSYPLLHYDFIDAMMLRYGKSGDFVNVRIAVLSKVYLTFFYLGYVYEKIFSKAQLQPTTKSKYQLLFDQINTNLMNYLKSLNNIDMNGQAGKNAMAEMLVSLHSLSDEVVTQNNAMTQLKRDIRDNQMALRNIIANNEILRDQYLKKVSEFWVVVTLIIVIVGICAALIVFNKSTFVFYIAGAILMVILIMKIVQMIKSFISKN
jgi:hypothetical protein